MHGKFSIKRACQHTLAGLLCAFTLLAGWQRTALALAVNKSAIVLLKVKDAQNNTLATGTGFIAKPDGTVVTNYHVLTDAAAMEAVLADGSVAAVKGIVKVDRLRDFAILKLQDGVYSALELGGAFKLREFDYTSALGYLSEEAEEPPKPSPLRQTYGIALGIHIQADPAFKVIYTTAPFGAGFSGGPVVDNNNRVVGVAMVESRNISMALPIDYVKPFLDGGETLTFERLRQEDQEAAEAFYYRGNFALYNGGEPESAVQLFKEALLLNPFLAIAHYDLAMAYQELGDMDNALGEYKAAVNINPGFPEGLSNLGGQLFRNGAVDDAILCFQKAITVFPNFVQGLSNLGAALIKKERFDEALPYLAKAVRINPEFALAYYNLGNAHLGKGQFTDARAAYEKAAALGLDFLSLHWKLFEIHRKEGRREDAVRELRLILEMEPDDSEAAKLLQEMTAAH